MAPPIDWEHLRRLLCALQDELLTKLLEARRELQTSTMAAVSDVTVADTIYQVDKVSEEIILHWLEQEWPTHWPVQLMMEGLEDRGAVTFPAGTPVEDTALKLIIDPIDGTREIMWDRRSAWALAALAPQKGEATSLLDIRVAAMTELPTTRAWRADQLSVVKGGAIVGESLNVLTGQRAPFVPTPYDGTDLHHGFSGFAMPFPGAKRTIAAITEEFYSRLEADDLHTLPIFEDQYLSTGGQFYDLMTGRLRLYGDLRPLVFTRQQRDFVLCAHPYDVCVALLAEALGVVITDPSGAPLDAPLDTTTAIGWVGYANAALAARAQPALDAALAAVLSPPR